MIAQAWVVTYSGRPYLMVRWHGESKWEQIPLD